MVAAIEPVERKQSFEVRSPASGELLANVPIHDEQAVQAEVARARAAQPRWAALSVPERCARLAKVADELARRADDIARTVCRENGKVLAEAFLHEIGPSLGVLRYFAAHAPRILAPEPVQLALARHRKSYLSFQPKGVVGVITPWNFPFFMPASDAAMALFAGNGAVIKPSELTPLSALALKECFDAAGIDPDLVRVVTGLGPTGQALIAAGPDHVVFTGSVATGRRVGMACAERMISYTLELGGKAPAIVLEDADLERATQAILWGGFANNGQICASVERVYAVEPVYERLVEGLSAKARALRQGPPEEPGTDLGAMTWARQREIVERLVKDAQDKGARLTAGGARGKEGGLYHEPTVLADCHHGMEVMTQEIFGPVIPLMKVSGEEEAVRLANDSHLGLGAYVFTRDVERGKRVAERLQVGSVMVNDVLAHAGMPEMPWGGIKQSGLGVVRSDRGLRELCHARHVNHDALPSLKRDPYWFPYTAAQTERVRKAVVGLFGGGVVGRLLRNVLGT